MLNEYKYSLRKNKEQLTKTGSLLRKAGVALKLQPAKTWLSSLISVFILSVR